MKLYHGTHIDNVSSIIEKGLLNKFEGVYLTDSAESAARWVGFRMAAQNCEKMVVIEVDLDKDSVVEGFDHSPMMEKIFGVGKSLLHEGDIDPEKITDIIYFEIKNR